MTFIIWNLNRMNRTEASYLAKTTIFVQHFDLSIFWEPVLSIWQMFSLPERTMCLHKDIAWRTLKEKTEARQRLENKRQHRLGTISHYWAISSFFLEEVDFCLTLCAFTWGSSVTFQTHPLLLCLSIFAVEERPSSFDYWFLWWKMGRIK